ncbi:PLAC8-like protein 1 [Discoglossus pictus]
MRGGIIRYYTYYLTGFAAQIHFLKGVCGLFCLPCLECYLSRNYGECPCFPLLLGSALAIRVGIRERHKIRGSLCEDWLAIYCCWPFAVCQMVRELKTRTSTLIYREKLSMGNTVI